MENELFSKLMEENIGYPIGTDLYLNGQWHTDFILCKYLQTVRGSIDFLVLILISWMNKRC